jgi:hypothetical protein
MAVSTNSVESAEEILQDLKTRAKAAHDAEDVFLMSILTDLIAVASPIVTKAVARQHREDRAKINAAHKALRGKMKEASKSDASGSQSAPDMSDF